MTQYFADLWPGHDMNEITMVREPGPKPPGVVRLSFEFDLPDIVDADFKLRPEVQREADPDPVSS